MSNDLMLIFNWWGVWLVMGIVSLPASVLWLSGLWDRGYGFSKALGWVVVGYAVWLVASLKLMPFSMGLIYFVIIGWVAVNLFILKRYWDWYRRMAWEHWKQWLKLEVVFLMVLATWSFVRGFQPDINGLEKFMDHGFVNTIIRSDYFPPQDMWFAGGAINYYYFGHYLAALMTRISGIATGATYNLMIATVMALSFVEALVLGASMVGIYQKQIRKVFVVHEKWKIVGGVLAAFFLTLRGNLHWGAYVLSKWLYELRGINLEESPGCWAYTINETRQCWGGEITLPDPTKPYWYPDATRYIPFTIHEFPIYSYVVADLHAHMINLVLVLLLLAGVVNVVDRGNVRWSDVGIWGLLVGVFYMTNAWDVPIYLLVIGVVLTIMTLMKYRLSRGAWSGLFIVGLVLVTGIYWFIYQLGILGENGQVVEASKAVATVLGEGFTWTLVLLLLVGGGYLVSQLRSEKNWDWTYHMLREVLPKAVAVLGIGMIANLPFRLQFEQIAQGVLPVHATSSISQLWVLWGWDWFLALSLLGVVIVKTWRWLLDRKVDWKLVTLIDWVVLGCYAVGIFLIVVPEFIYVKDIYIADYHRANTMFKLVYQSWTLFAFSGAYTVVRLLSMPVGKGWRNRGSKLVWVGVVMLGIFVVGKYPGKAIQSYYGIIIDYADGTRDFKEYKGINGETWLEKEPSEYAALAWLRQLPGQPVILEAPGDSYTEFNRFSAYTGLPTVQGWKVHEWLWRGSYDEPGRRDAEVEHVYTAIDLQAIKPLYQDDPVPSVLEVLRLHKVEYVIVGTKERERYKESLNEENFKALGEVVFEEGETRIYKVR